MIDIKDRLAEALHVRGMTAADLARKSGVDKGSISTVRLFGRKPRQIPSA